MQYYIEGDFVNSVMWSEACLRAVPDWPYAFLAMHSIAAAYHKAGLTRMADTWARSAVAAAPFFEPARSYLMP
jgi:hypothetical protein